MRHIVMVACLAVRYVSTLFHTMHDLKKKKKLLNIKRVFLISLKLLSEIFLFLRVTDRDIRNVRTYIGVHVQYP
jgi:hypothetical protein